MVSGQWSVIRREESTIDDRSSIGKITVRGLWTGGNDRGMALVMALLMVVTLVGAVMIVSFVGGRGLDDDIRCEVTRGRMLEVKRALLGRLADVGGGKDITSCGGFMSDYGMPDDPANFNIAILLSSQGSNWSYDDTQKFWAGYRGERYLNPPQGQPDPETKFLDGWGFEIDLMLSGDSIEIKSKGSDGKDGGSGDYKEDIVESFYWQRGVTVNNRTGSDGEFRLIYPSKGLVMSAGQILSDGSSGAFSSIPVGLMKIEVLDTSAASELQSIRMLCLPPGKTNYFISVK